MPEKRRRLVAAGCRHAVRGPPGKDDEDENGGHPARSRAFHASDEEVAPELACDEARLGADEVQHLDDVPVAGHSAPRGEDDGQHRGGEHQDEHRDADRHRRMRHRHQPVDPGAVVVEAGGRQMRAQRGAQRLEIRRRDGIEGDDNQPRHRQFVQIEAGAEPWLEQPRGGLAIDDLHRLHALRGAGDLGGRGERGLHVQPVRRLDLDRRLSRDLALPYRGGVAHQRHRAEGQARQEGHDGDDDDQRTAGDVLRRHDRRGAALRTLAGRRSRFRRYPGLVERFRRFSHKCPAFRPTGSAGARRPGPSGRGREWRSPPPCPAG